MLQVDIQPTFKEWRPERIGEGLDPLKGLGIGVARAEKLLRPMEKTVVPPWRMTASGAVEFASPGSLSLGPSEARIENRSRAENHSV